MHMTLWLRDSGRPEGLATPHSRAPLNSREMQMTLNIDFNILYPIHKNPNECPRDPHIRDQEDSVFRGRVGVRAKVARKREDFKLILIDTRETVGVDGIYF